MTQTSVAVLGAGPAGLMAAHRLLEAGFAVSIFDAEPRPGGLCGTRTLGTPHGDFRFDYGGHRFLTRDPELLRFVDELMGDDLLHARRSSVIRYRGRTYDYPLNIGNLLRQAPPGLLLGAGFDLLTGGLTRRTSPRGEQASFADWTRHRFGDTLYRHFFAGYSEKLWGIPPETLSGDWAEQRIARLDLRQVARLMLPGHDRGLRGYARHYRYPRLGFGQLFERLGQSLNRLGGDILTGHRVRGLVCEDRRVRAIRTEHAGRLREWPVDAVINTLPLPSVVRMLGGECGLRFRALRFLNIPLAGEAVSPHTWQYLSDPDMLATRLQEPKRRSPAMAPEGFTSVMLEIPCQSGDHRWTAPESVLAERAWSDLVRLGVDRDRDLGYRQSQYAAHAYPLMDLRYAAERRKAIDCLNRYDNLISCGRQGTFRYIFTDTAMEMGQMAACCLIEQEDLRHAIYEHRNEAHVIETDHLDNEPRN
ncbi:FAD-dependent oxidoreductase [Saccharospirillum salsuginis]|uniref:Amine oxidase n=1 Tax=Saccharospirillum salsuginis TaxID=418750 RepID=A0A918KM65_9GAMM|nr:FAD-dependent oxidoreductase [Saccharospirillum salsuginis]GGX66156.1 amine oxidase [Saccharospirillum salsuginis]